MAAPAEVEALDSLAVPAMEERYLRLMIRHHRGAFAMSDYAASRAGSERIRLLARKMSVGQKSEIEAMQAMLTKRALPPEPEDTSGHGSASGHG